MLEKKVLSGIESSPQSRRCPEPLFALIEGKEKEVPKMLFFNQRGNPFLELKYG